VSPALPLFGLSANPFDDHVLDPLARPDDVDLFTAVDGFGALAEVGAFLVSRAAAADGPTFVLVKGPDGSGRTSVANFVVSAWKVASADARHLLLPRVPLGETRSARRAIGEWLAALRNEIRRAGLPLPDALDAHLKEVLTAGPEQLGFVADLRYVLSEIDALAIERGHFVVALFDNLDVVDLAPTAVSAFADTRALVVTVAGDYHSQLDPLLGEHGTAAFPPERTRIVQLRHLHQDEIAELARSRWEHAAKYSYTDVLAPPLPFDPAALGNALATGESGPRTLRRVMGILHDLLELRESQLAGQPGVTEEQLHFDAAELDAHVRILDRLGADA
jgi:hypothetical protein